jgi:hypothetical protein
VLANSGEQLVEEVPPILLGFALEALAKAKGLTSICAKNFPVRSPKRASCLMM